MLYKYPQRMLSKLDESWLPTASRRQGLSCCGGASAMPGTGFSASLGLSETLVTILPWRWGKRRAGAFEPLDRCLLSAQAYTGRDATSGYRLVKRALQRCRHAILN